jgi:drug/metabolite transporter (DMT)-like permease
MNVITFGLILVSVSLSAAAQILFKYGVTSAKVGFEGTGVIPVLLSYLLTPGVIGGLALYGIGTLLWLNVLSRIEVSQAYPFVGLGFLLTALLGMVLFGDNVNAWRIGGMVLIGAGIYLVARS